MKDMIDQIAAWAFAALYVSEGWHKHWQITGLLASKARAVVVFDRILNRRFEA